MSWESRLAKGGSEPEMQLWKILNEMKLPFMRNVTISTPFRDYPVEADTLVEDVLVIEVQSEYFHSKSTRHRKDLAKLQCFEAMGLGILWLYDDELEWANQKKKGEVWRPLLKSWITIMIDHARNVRRNYLRLQEQAVNVPLVQHPDLGMVSLRADVRRR